MGYPLQKQAGIAKPKLLLLVVFVFIGVLVLMGVLIGAGSGSKSESRVAGDNFMQLITTRQAEPSYSILTDRLKKQVGSQTDWEASITTSFKDKPSYKFTSSTILKNLGNTYDKNANAQWLVYKVTLSDKKSYKMSILIFKEGSGWKVDEFQSVQL